MRTEKKTVYNHNHVMFAVFVLRLQARMKNAQARQLIDMDNQKQGHFTFFYVDIYRNVATQFRSLSVDFSSSKIFVFFCFYARFKWRGQNN